MSSASTPGMPRLSSQTLNNIIAKKLEAADAINLALGDIHTPNPQPVRQQRRERQTRSIVLVVVHQGQRPPREE